MFWLIADMSVLRDKDVSGLCEMKIKLNEWRDVARQIRDSKLIPHSISDVLHAIALFLTQRTNGFASRRF